MTNGQLLLAWLGIAAMVAILAGLFAKRRLQQCLSFGVYVGVVAGCEMLVMLFPDRFYTRGFWMAKQALYDVLKVFVALELAYRVVRAFPGATRTVRLSVLALLATSTVVIMSGPWGGGFSTMTEWQPRVVFGVVSLFTLTALVVLWYNLPVLSWHRALLMGFSGYLLAFTVVLNVLRTKGWQLLSWLSLLDTVAYLAMLVWWAVMAWTPEREAIGIPAMVRRKLGLEPA